MKKILALVMTAALLFALASVCFAAEGGLIAVAQRGTPTVDGEKDAAYDACETYTGEKIRNGTDTGARHSFQILYDDEWVYIYEFVSDTTLFGDMETIANYQYDTTEVCMDIWNEGPASYDLTNDFWVGITPYGEINSESKADALGADMEFMQVATKVVDGTGYYVEWAFNIKGIDPTFELKSGNSIGLEISVNDNTDNVQRTMCLGWNDQTDGASGNPSVFGQIDFDVAAEVAPPPPPETRPNLATGCVVAASSVETADFPPELAVDGDVATRWASAYEDPTWFTMDLGAIYKLDKIIVNWETASAKEFTLSVSEDNVNWTVVATETNGVGPKEVTYTFEPTNGQYVKLDSASRSTEYGNSVYEWGVYGEATDAPAAVAAPVVVDTPAPAPAPVTTAPQTADAAIVLAVVSMLSAAGAFISKKRG